MYVYFFSFYSHSIPYESIWIPFFAISWCLFQHLRVCFHPHGILPLGFSFNGPLGWSIPPRWNQLKKHFVFVQFVWQFVSQPSIFNYLIENCLFIINFHRLRLFETWKTPRALRVKAEAPEQFLPESFNFPKETPYHKLDVKVFPMTLVSIWRCYSCPVARPLKLRWTGLQWRPSSSSVARALLCSSSTNVGCVQSWVTMGSILWT